MLPKENEADAAGLEQTVDQAIAACNGDLRATIRSLVIANSFLAEHNQVLAAELDYPWRWISPGYTRSANRRRMGTGDPE